MKSNAAVPCSSPLSQATASGHDDAGAAADRVQGVLLAVSFECQEVDIDAAHKKALALGRTEAHAVRAYLDVLHQPQGPDPQVLEDSVTQLEQDVNQEADPVARVMLIQKRIDAEGELSAVQGNGEPDAAAAEAAFVEHALRFSQRKGLSWKAWREVGVPASVLKRTGLPRGARPPAGD